MSCPICAIHKGGFLSEAAYVAFDKKLSRAMTNCDLTEIEREEPCGPFLKFRYLCNRCGSCWLLSVPDQAFRGGWEEITCK